MALGKVICVPDPAEAAARDAAMIAGVTDEPVEAPALPGIAGGLIAAGSPHAGELFAQLVLDGRHFDDVHGAGWRFVTEAAEAEVSALDPDLVDWFADLGGSVVAGVGDAWFADHACGWALQRPDFHLYGTATDARSASSLLDDLRGRISA
jgi:hypothetical protein